MHNKNRLLGRYTYAVITAFILLVSVSRALGAEVNTSLTINNSLPYLGNFSIITDLNFSYSGNSSFWCNATVNDRNGAGEILKVNSTFWNTAEANENSNDSVSYHYTNSSCELVNANNTSKHAYCYFDIGNISLGNWNYKIRAFDNSGNNSTTITIHVHLCGDGDCNYGETCSLCEIDCGICETQQDVGGGSGGGYVTPTSYYVLESTGIFEKCIVVGDELSFNVGEESYALTLISLTSELITMKLNSTSINVTMPLGETKSFDLDNDGWYDITINLKKITAGKACLIIETFAKILVETAEQDLMNELSYNKCGDGVCQEVENCENCASDCNQCLTESSVLSNKSVITPLQGNIFAIAVLCCIGLGIYLSRKFAHTTRFDRGR